MAECSAQQSTETPQRDPKASTLSADNSLLSWTWLLRETGQQGGRWTRPVLSQGDVLTGTALVENTKGAVVSLQPCRRSTGQDFCLHWRSDKGVGRPRTHRANGQIRVQHPSPLLYLMLLLIGQACWGEVAGHAWDFAIFSVSLELVRVMVDAHLVELGVGVFLVGRGIPVLETPIIKSPRITILCESGRREKKFGALNSRPWLCTASSLAGLWS